MSGHANGIIGMQFWSTPSRAEVDLRRYARGYPRGRSSCRSIDRVHCNLIGIRPQCTRRSYCSVRTATRCLRDARSTSITSSNSAPPGNVHGLAAIHRVRMNSKHEDFCTIAPNRSHLSRAAQAGGRDNDRTGHRNYSTHELEQIPVSKLREPT